MAPDPWRRFSFVDQLDAYERKREKKNEQSSQQQDPTQMQPATEAEAGIPSELPDLIGGGGWTRTNDLRIMRPSL